MSTRDRIKMSAEERLAFVDGERTVIVTSFGPRGWPHSMPMWFVETGETYDQLRGVMVEAEAELVEDYDAVLALGRELGVRYGGGAEGLEVEEALARQAAKRVAIRFRPRRVVSWDHRKI